MTEMLHKLENLTKIDIDLFKRHRRILRSNPAFLPILLTGGIGDVICLIDTLKILASRYQVLIYTKHDEALRYFCPELPVFKEMPDYFWHLELDSIATFCLSDYFQGFLLKEHEELFVIHKNILARSPQLEMLIGSRKYFLINEFCKNTRFNKRNLAAYCLNLI